MNWFQDERTSKTCWLFLGFNQEPTKGHTPKYKTLASASAADTPTNAGYARLAAQGVLATSDRKVATGRHRSEIHAGGGSTGPVQGMRIGENHQKDVICVQQKLEQLYIYIYQWSFGISVSRLL